MAAAQVREACGIPGTSVHTTFLCRDKPAMKDALREAGVPCAQSMGSKDADEIRLFSAKIGFPVIVKPRDAAGASGTYKCTNERELEHAMAAFGVGQGGSVAVEEFIEGHEGFWDTISIGGRVVHEFVCHYYPNVLEAMRTRWISPQFICTNRVDGPGYDEVKAMGRKVVGALGIETGATHMEWFFGPKGLKFSEIGCRPPGVRAWDLYAAGNDFDIYREWAMAVVHGRPAQSLSRRFSAGIIALRPDHDGRIAGYEGVEEIERAFGQWIIDAHLPPAGTPTQPVEAGYMANAWIRMKHPDYDELRRMLDARGPHGAGSRVLTLMASPRAVVLLGAQRFDPSLRSTVEALGVQGLIAVVTAGWQERESEDGELHEHLKNRSINLRLHRRAEEVFARDAELAKLHRKRQQTLRHKQDFYRVRLEHELAANHVILQRNAPPAILEEEEAASLGAIRLLDEYHLGQCQRVHEEFEAEATPFERPWVARHRRELARILGDCGAIAIAGGHVASLLNRLRLFGIAELLDAQPVFAWSAGAMAVSERVVLFHDSPPQGPGASEVLDRGLALVPGVVPLPQPETRLRLDDPERVGVLARRFAPALCLTLPARAHVTFEDPRLVRPSEVSRLSPDGTCVPFEESAS